MLGYRLLIKQHPLFASGFISELIIIIRVALNHLHLDDVTIIHQTVIIVDISTNCLKYYPNAIPK